MKLSALEERLHERAIQLSREHRQVEASLIEVMMQIRATALFEKLDVNGIFEYAMKFLNFCESTAYALKATALRCVEIPALGTAIAELRLPLGKAKRLLAIIDPENAEDLITFAETATYREIEQLAATIKPRAIPATRITFVNKTTVRLTTCFDLEGLSMHERVKSLEAQRGNHGDFQKVLYQTYLFHRDPVLKAKRARTRSARAEKPEDSEAEFSARAENQRVPLTAEQKHAVYLRDQGRCTHRHADGRRCNRDRYVEIHHVVPISEGGTNDPSNLTTLCSFHHGLTHRMRSDPGRSGDSTRAF